MVIQVSRILQTTCGSPKFFHRREEFCNMAASCCISLSAVAREEGRLKKNLFLDRGVDRQGRANLRCQLLLSGAGEHGVTTVFAMHQKPVP